MSNAWQRKYDENVAQDRATRERWEIVDVRLSWELLTDRERAIVLATYYDDVVIPPEEPREPRRWWQR